MPCLHYNSQASGPCKEKLRTVQYIHKIYFTGSLLSIYRPGTHQENTNIYGTLKKTTGPWPHSRSSGRAQDTSNYLRTKFTHFFTHIHLIIHNNMNSIVCLL